MATIFSHALVGATIVKLLPDRCRTPRLYFASAFAAIAPDMDYLGFVQHVPYESFWGHRGFTHSILFSSFVALLFVFAFRLKVNHQGQRISQFLEFGIIFLAGVSHALLDACTNGGLGIAFFSPVDVTRYFFSWRPIEVSPMGLRFFSASGLMVLASEFFWIVLPCFALIGMKKFYALQFKNLKK